MTTQVEKFKDRVNKSTFINKNNERVTKIFNFIDLTAAFSIKVKKKVKVKGTYKHSANKEKDYSLPTIFENTILRASDNSIRRYLNECHPDLQKLIQKQEIDTIKPICGEITIVTKAGLRIVVTTISKSERNVKITYKKQILFNGKTTVVIDKEELPSKVA